jgi:uncharacterized protein RhaS with RHS repeats
MNQDPIGLAGGLNLYRYTENNPLKYVDPSGECLNFIIGQLLGLFEIGPLNILTETNVGGTDVNTYYQDEFQIALLQGQAAQQEAGITLAPLEPITPTLDPNAGGPEIQAPQ